MGKIGQAGYAKFIASDVVRKLKEDRLPEVEKAWAKLPEGFRIVLYKNAGLDVGRVPDGLAGLSQDERRALQAANTRLGELQVVAARALIGAVFSRSRV